MSVIEGEIQNLDGESEVAEGEFNSKSIGLRVQKKLASKMSTKGVAKQFVDDTTSELLDHVYRIAKVEMDHKKDAEKLIKNIIKITVKVGILIRNKQFNADEIKLAEQFRQKFNTIAMMVVSFCDIDFSFDQQFLSQQIHSCEQILHNLVKRHLTDKSQKRIDNVFSFFRNEDRLLKIFQADGPHKKSLDGVVSCLNKLAENGDL